jgi:multiple sugar transport system ATP-binding protein
MSSVHLRGVGKRFGDVAAVDALDLDIADGEFFVLLGPSGAGKTTTLRLVAGLEQPDRGCLYPHLSVYDNLAFPLRSPMRRLAEADVRRRVERVAATLHIDAKLGRKATALSGGEMQRVAIGRALVREPRVFLMDEPLSSLDAQLREELRVELKRLQRESRATVLYVTHDQVEATTLADRIGILEQGRLRQVGSPMDIYDDPRSLHVAQRLGLPAVNVLPAAWFDGAADVRATHVAIRPEDVAVDADAAAVAGDHAYRVIECSLVKHLVVAERAGVEVRARAVLDRPIGPGARVALRFAPERFLYFDAAGQRLPS